MNHPRINAVEDIFIKENKGTIRVPRLFDLKIALLLTLNSRNHNVKFLNTVIFALFGFKFISVLSVHIYMIKGQFTRGKESVKDEEGRRRPTTTKTFENMVWVEQVLKKDCPVNCRMIMRSIRIPKTIIVQHITRDDLKKRMLYSCFVQHALTTEQLEFKSECRVCCIRF